MLDSFPTLSPASFFNFVFPVSYHAGMFSKRSAFLLPDTSSLFMEDCFASIAMAWSEEGLFFHVHVEDSPEQSFFPKVQEGDAVEFFIDTRDLKSAGSSHRFCHHFVFLPKESQGVTSAEITRFRTDDSHPLSDPNSLTCETQLLKKGYEMKITIPTESLYGYDPASFDRLGFTYRIPRYQKPSQHFIVSSDQVVIEQHPTLWSSCKLWKK